MKKITLLIALMLIMAVSVSALELEPTITGSATVTWGVDLNNNATGFKSETASSFSLTLLSGSETKGADADVYGEITLDGFGVEFGDTLGIDIEDSTFWYNSDGDELDAIELSITGDVTDVDSDKIQTGLNVKAPTVTAKIVLSPTMSLIIASAPEIQINYAEVLDKESDGTNDIDAAVKDEDDYGDTTGGITLAMDLDPITINLEVASAQTWEDNDENDYAMQVTIGAAVAPATIEASFASGFGYAASPMGLGLSVSLELGIIDPTILFDLELNENSTLFDAVVKLPFTVSDDITATLTTSIAEDGVDATDLDLDVKAEASLKVSLATLTFDAILKDLIVEDALGVDINAKVVLALNDTTSLTVDGGYDMGVVATDDDELVHLAASVDLTMIPNTTITLKYASDQLLSDMVNHADNPAQDKGDVTLAAVVKY